MKKKEGAGKTLPNKRDRMSQPNTKAAQSEGAQMKNDERSQHRTTTTWMVALWVGLTIALTNAAATHFQWRGFWVTQVHLLVSVVALYFLLAPRRSYSERK